MAARFLERASTLAFLGFFLAGFAALEILRLAARVGRRAPRGPVRSLLLLPHDDRDQSGARHRFGAWARRLAARGLRVRVAYPNPPGEVDRLWGPSRARLERLAAITFARRAAQCLAAPRFDAVVYGRHALPRFPYGGTRMERLLVALNPRTFLDIDDATWEESAPGPGTGPIARFLHLLTRPARAKDAMGIVSGVLAGSRHLAAHARERNPRVALLPTCVDPDAVPTRDHGPVARPVVGWIGTPGNLAHLSVAAPALAALARERPIVLRIVSSEPWSHPGVPVDFVPWTAGGEAEAVAGFDVGIMPLAATRDAEGKCGLKLLQYAAAGVPAVASPVGANREIVRPGETGILAANDAEWEEGLRRLLDDPGLRARLGAGARADARARWSYDAWEPALLAALDACPDARERG